MRSWSFPSAATGIGTQRSRGRLNTPARFPAGSTVSSTSVSVRVGVSASSTGLRSIPRSRTVVRPGVPGGSAGGVRVREASSARCHERSDVIQGGAGGAEAVASPKG
jgi:hypothetical protein